MNIVSPEGLCLAVVATFLATSIFWIIVISGTEERTNKNTEASGVWRFKDRAYKLTKISPETGVNL